MRGLDVPEYEGEVGVIYSFEDTRIYNTSVHRCTSPHIRVNLKSPKIKHFTYLACCHTKHAWTEVTKEKYQFLSSIDPC